MLKITESIFFIQNIQQSVPPVYLLLQLSHYPLVQNVYVPVKCPLHLSKIHSITQTFKFLQKTEGKIAQSRMLAEKLQEEYEKGNYVIAGGDFNQTFEGIDTYPILDTDNWTPGEIGEDDIPEGFSFAVSDNVPTCRLLNGPYSGNYEDSQVYVLDGFIVSDNLEILDIENIDTEFQYSDHQPVRLTVKLTQMD